MIRILSFQPFSLYYNGGGSRILRRLYMGREVQVTSLAVEGVAYSRKTGEIKEITIDAFPLTRWWMKWRLRNAAIWLRQNGLKFITMNKIRRAASALDYDVIHIVDHGVYSTALCNEQFTAGKKLWVSFHDHFSTTSGSHANSETLWNAADRILVISNELGQAYQKLFGDKAFEIVTDGVTDKEMSLPLSGSAGTPAIVYFAGLLHLDYQPLFKVFADALDLLASEGLTFKMILRGTQQIDFLNRRSFEIEYRPVSLDSDELKRELDEAAILYLPIKFTKPDFYLYSLSTKMIGYLGGAGAIFYHGPADSAAANLLSASAAAVCSDAMDTAALAGAIKELINNSVTISSNAKELARKEFNLGTIQQRFWQTDGNL